MEKREEQEKKEEWKERDETTNGKEVPADKRKKIQRGRIIFRKEGTKGFIEAGYIYSLMWITPKIDERRSRLSQIVQVLLLLGVGNMKTKRSKLLNH